MRDDRPLIDFGSVLEMGLRKQQLDLQRENQQFGQMVGMISLGMELRQKNHEMEMSDKAFVQESLNREVQRKRDEAVMRESLSRTDAQNYELEQKKRMDEEQDADKKLLRAFHDSEQISKYKAMQDRFATSIAQGDLAQAFMLSDSIASGWNTEMAKMNTVNEALRQRGVFGLPGSLASPSELLKPFDEKRYTVELSNSKRITYDTLGQDGTAALKPNETIASTTKEQWSLNDVREKVASGTNEERREAIRILSTLSKDPASRKFILDSVMARIPAGTNKGRIGLWRLDPSLDEVDEEAVKRITEDPEFKNVLAAYRAKKPYVRINPQTNVKEPPRDPAFLIRAEIEAHDLSPLTKKRVAEIVDPPAAVPGAASGATPAGADRRVDLSKNATKKSDRYAVGGVAKVTPERFDSFVREFNSMPPEQKVAKLKDLQANLKEAMDKDMPEAAAYTSAMIAAVSPGNEEAFKKSLAWYEQARSARRAAMDAFTQNVQTAKKRAGLALGAIAAAGAYMPATYAAGLVGGGFLVKLSVGGLVGWAGSASLRKIQNEIVSDFESDEELQNARLAGEIITDVTTLGLMALPAVVRNVPKLSKFGGHLKRIVMEDGKYIKPSKVGKRFSEYFSRNPKALREVEDVLETGGGIDDVALDRILSEHAADEAAKVATEASHLESGGTFTAEQIDAMLDEAAEATKEAVRKTKASAAARKAVETRKANTAAEKLRLQQLREAAKARRIQRVKDKIAEEMAPYRGDPKAEPGTTMSADDIRMRLFGGGNFQ